MWSSDYCITYSGVFLLYILFIIKIIKYYSEQRTLIQVINSSKLILILCVECSYVIPEVIPWNLNIPHNIIGMEGSNELPSRSGRIILLI